jgi:hypothetical protein
LLKKDQFDAIDEAARNPATPTPDAERSAQRAEIEANTKGLEERAKSLGERKSNDQGRLALERRDIDRLEALIRGWLERTP